MTAIAPLDFYFDFASPYGYFMAEKIGALAARHGRAVRWRPILLFAVLRALQLPPPMAPGAKHDYMVLDFERSARFLGVPFRMPRKFPLATQHAARAHGVLAEVDPEAAVRFALAMLRACFIDGAPIDELDEVAMRAADACPAAGDAAELKRAIVSDAAKSALARAIDEAAARGVFGSPFVFVDGEPFFGVDRLPQIAARLEGALAPAVLNTPKELA